MKCVERLVMAHIKASMPGTLDPVQFAYRSNRPEEDAISITIHAAVTHLDKRNTCVRMLFLNYSSAFHTIVPSKLDTKLRASSVLCCTSCSPTTTWLCKTPTPSSSLLTAQWL